MLQPVDENVGFLTSEILDCIAKVFDFDSILPYPFININGYPVLLNRKSETSKKVLLKTEKKDKIKYYFLKQLPWYIKKENIEKIIQYQAVLHDNTQLSPEILPTNTGKIFLEFRESTYFLQEYTVGYSWKYSTQQAEEAGKSLAELHEFSLKENKRLPTMPEETNMSTALGMLNMVIRDFKRRRKLNNLKNDDYFNFIKKVRKEIYEIEKKLQVSSTNQLKHIVHGDYNPTNIIFNEENKVLKIIDFDNLCIDYNYHDIAEGIVAFSVVKYRKNSSRFKSFKPDNDIAKAFFNGFKQKNGIEIDYNLLNMYIQSTMIEYTCLGLLREDFNILEASQYIEQLNSTIPSLV